MKTSKLNLIWANKPGCSLAVAEIWIDRDHLWITIFLDEKDRRLKVEVLPPLGGACAALLDLSEAVNLIEHARRDLLAMSSGNN